jgi:hypothetical protein
MNAIPVSRGLPGLAAAIFAGGLSVAFLLIALLHADTMLVFLAYFAAMPLYLAGLGAGVLAGIVATGTGMTVLYLTQTSNFPVLYAIAYGIPAIMLTFLALRYRLDAGQKLHWYPEGKLLTAITLYPCALFLLFAWAATSHPGGLLDLTQQAFDKFATQFAAKLDEDQAEIFRQAMANAAKFAPALVAYTWILVAVLSMGGAQHILRRQKLNLRDSLSIRSLHVAPQFIYAVAATGLMGVFAASPYDYIGQNLSMVLGLPYLFVGIAIAHCWAASLKHRAFFLVPFYLIMGLLPWTALIVAGVGIIDQWADFRRRIPGTPTV